MLIDAEKASDKVQDPFMIKTLSKVGVEGAFLNIIKAIYESPTANTHHTQQAKTKSFPIKMRNKTRMFAFTTSIQHNIGSPSQSDQTSKRNKGIQIGKEDAKLSLFAHRQSYRCHQKST